MNANEFAFCALISHSEGTDRVADSYRVCYAFKHYIVDLSDHPAVTLEWTGEKLDSLGPKYKGLISTAAGRYQITKGTWLRAKLACNLPDFSPNSQDLAALWIIKQQGALADLEAGDVLTALHKCRNIWASLPGGDSGQPQMRLALCLDQYTQAGGVIAAAA